MFHPGDQLGDFKIESCLSDSSSVYTIYEATQVSLDRKVALKILSSYLTGNTSFVKKFQKEGKACARMHEHPYVPKVYSTGEVEGHLYMAMELVDGKTLKEHLEKKRRLSCKEALEISIKIAEAVKALHDVDIIHRDLQPKNIMLQDDGDLKILEFGLAKIDSGDSTREGEALGTIYYMSPEQLMGMEIDKKSDFYSLGMILWVLITGSVPFDEDPTTYLAMVHMGESLPSHELEELELQDDVKNLIEVLTAHDISERPECIDEIIEAMQFCLTAEIEGVKPKKEEKEEEVKEVVEEEVAEPQESWTWLIIIALVIFALGAIYTYFQFGKKEDPLKDLPLIERQKKQQARQFEFLKLKPKVIYELEKLPQSRLFLNRQNLYFKISGDVVYLNISKKELTNLGFGEPIEAIAPTSPNIYFLKGKEQLIEFEVNNKKEKELWLLPDHISQSRLIYEDKIFLVNTNGELLGMMLKNGKEIIRSNISPNFNTRLFISGKRIIFPTKDHEFHVISMDNGRILDTLSLKACNPGVLPIFYEKNFFLYTKDQKIQKFDIHDNDAQSPKATFPPGDEILDSKLKQFFPHKGKIYAVTDDGKIMAWDRDLAGQTTAWKTISSPIFLDSLNFAEDFMVMVLNNKILYFFN
ncbi:serine/threonine protein kinase [Candidatus Riflebacteria bacterium]